VQAVETTSANPLLLLGESLNVAQGDQPVVATIAPQYVVPADLDQHLPQAGPSSIISDKIWSSINLNEGFEVTIPGTQDLTPEAMTMASHIFDLSECSGGADTPSPFRRLLTPHPESPGRLTQDEIADISSLITSNPLATPTSSPPRSPSPSHLHNADALQPPLPDETHMQGNTPQTTHQVAQSALTVEPHMLRDQRPISPMSDLTIQDSSDDEMDQDQTLPPLIDNQVVEMDQTLPPLIDNQVADMDVDEVQAVPHQQDDVVLQHEPPQLPVNIVDDDQAAPDHQNDVGLQHDLSQLPVNNPIGQPDNRGEREEPHHAVVSSGEEEVEPLPPRRKTRRPAAATQRHMTESDSVSDRRLRSRAINARDPSRPVLSSTHPLSQPSMDASVPTPLFPASERDRSRLTKKVVKGSFEGKLYSQIRAQPEILTLEVPEVCI
jgi:hypothetical protein